MLSEESLARKCETPCVRDRGPKVNAERKTERETDSLISCVAKNADETSSRALMTR